MPFVPLPKKEVQVKSKWFCFCYHVYIFSLHECQNRELPRLRLAGCIFISLGKHTIVITPPNLRSERYGSNGWSPEAVSYEVQQVFQGLQKQEINIVTINFQVKQNKHYLATHLSFQHKKAIHGHIQNWLPGTLEWKIVFCWPIFF